MYLALVLTAVLTVGSDSAHLARLDSAILKEAQAGFSGVVLLGSKTGVIFERAYGNARNQGAPAHDLAFWLASDSKQVTAAAILKLQERGKLKVTDSISRFFDSVPQEKREITLHNLLTHTSGLPHEYEADGIIERKKAVEAILELALRSPPGEKYSYSNDGYTLLAAIVEIASGIPFDRYIVDSLMAPAGMVHSGVWGEERAGVSIAPMADMRNGQRQRATIMKDGHSVGNWGYRGPTGVYASARDVFRWVQAIQADKVMSAASRAQLLGRHVLLRSDSTGSGYSGYGWGVRVEGGRDTWYSHSGNEDWLGHNAIIRFTPAGDVVVVLSNSGDVAGSGWSARISRIIRQIMDGAR
jgi:CubicO group peptidase (beta-lactamase class C family)